MKTINPKKIKRAVREIVFILITFNSLNGLSQQRENLHHLFNAKGNSMLTFASGIPYIAAIEYAYGFSDRFTVGVTIGKTPNTTGYGLKIRAILYQPNENYRIYFRAPIFYYPKTKRFGNEPWVLTWPVISSEWKLKSGTFLSFGGGLVKAHCLHALLGQKMGTAHPPLPDHHATPPPAQHHHENEGFQGGTWNTVHAGVAFPLAERITFHGEISAVMKGFKLAVRDYIGGPPLILVFGIAWSL